MGKNRGKTKETQTGNPMKKEKKMEEKGEKRME